MAFLTQVRAGGKQYIYLTEYCGNQQFTTKNERRIYAFGSTAIALIRMKRWVGRYESDFPKELKEQGFTKKDLLAWIKQIETGRTPRGKLFKVEFENVEYYNI